MSEHDRSGVPQRCRHCPVRGGVLQTVLFSNIVSDLQFREDLAKRVIHSRVFSNGHPV